MEEEMLAETSEPMVIGKKPIGYCVQRVREIRGMKQFELADFIGITQQTLSKFENSTSLRKTTVEKLAAGLGVTVGFLENFDDDEFRNSIINFHAESSISGQLNSGRYVNNCPKDILDLIQKELSYLREQNILLIEKLSKKE